MNIGRESCTYLVAAATIVLTFVGCFESFAQNDKPKFQNRRFDENWSNYDSGADAGFFDRMKNIDVSDDVNVSFGGEIRIREEVWRAFGFSDANDDEFTLYRVFLHSDWRIGDSWRVFVQGKFTDVSSRDLPGGQRDSLDADEGDIWNTFIEYNGDTNKTDLTVRLGRQELQLGKQRLISPLDWANNRRIFDGISAQVAGKSSPWKVDAFVTRPVVNDADDFNDWNDDVVFGGVYYTRQFTDKKLTLDAYLLGLFADSDAPVEQDRYTLGTRVAGAIKGSEHFSYDVETAIQFGDQEDSDIFAWMATGEVTYRRNDISWKPWVTAGVDYASGDSDPTDGDVETFNHMFPLGHAYLGFIDAVGRQNIIDLRATVGAWPIPNKLMVRGDVHYLMLADDNDGLYNAGGALSRPPFLAGTSTPANEDDVGVEIDLTAKYIFNPSTNIQVGYSHFVGGDYISATGADDDIDFFYTQFTFKF
jgi:hypothetical protein